MYDVESDYDQSDIYNEDLINGYYSSFTVTKNEHKNPFNKEKEYIFKINKKNGIIYYCRSDKEEKECYSFIVNPDSFYKKYKITSVSKPRSYGGKRKTKKSKKSKKSRKSKTSKKQ